MYDIINKNLFVHPHGAMDTNTSPSIWLALFGVLSPIVSFIGAVWVSGYRVGKTESELRVELSTLKKSVGTLSGAVTELAEIDCVEEEDLQKAEYLTRKDLVREQEICRRDLDHKAELFARQMITISTSIADHASSIKDIALEMKNMSNSVSTELRHMREALIKKGIIE